MVAKAPYKRGGRGRSGFRDYLGIYCRSTWEANFSQICNLWVERGEILRWEYEPKRFEFTSIKRGNRSYMPDFRLFFPDGRAEWREIKGYMDNDSRVKLKRFAKFYPEETLVVIDKVAYGELKKIYQPLLPNWES